MTGKEIFFQMVDEGRKGYNVGLSVGSDKLMSYTDGYLPGTSYLIGGTSGVSKSTYTLWAFIYQPLIDFLKGNGLERDPHWIMFNLEMTQPQIYAKLVSMYIFDNFGIELRFKDIFSRGKNTILSDVNYDILQKCGEFLDILDKRIVCYDGSLDEKKYIQVLDFQLKKYGSWKEGVFYPNNPNQILGIIIDHCSLIRASAGRSKKDEMDAISRASVAFRNRTRIISPIHVAQFNRNANSDVRIKQNLQEPDYTDFKDSGSLYEDSHVVIALHSPFKCKLSRYHNYDIKMLEQVFLSIILLKTRFGTSDIVIPMGFYGDSSHYAELPKPEEIYDYEKYKTPMWLKGEIKEEVKEEEDKKTKSKFIFTL